MIGLVSSVHQYFYYLYVILLAICELGFCCDCNEDATQDLGRIFTECFSEDRPVVLIKYLRGAVHLATI